MTRTTPPRPLDVTAVFPELTALARTTTRLHPRPGTPTVHESSVAGPLLWPADEPWPVCPDDHTSSYYRTLQSLDDVRRYRQLLDDAWARPQFTAEEHAELDRLRAGHPSDRVDPAVPLLPIAQLYARDTPGFNGPDGCDLLQVLWCPFEHGDEALPGVQLRWRRADDVAALLTDPPAPFLVEHDDYVPEACVVHPEQVREYPAPHELPGGLRERIRVWEDAEGLVYQYELGVATGWKLGGWAPWSFRDPSPEICGVCDAVMQPFLYVDSSEWDGNDSWRPLEDADEHQADHRYPHMPTRVEIGRSYGMQIYTCPTSHDHPLSTVTQ
ncbi:hypothetical protein ACIBSV_45995 [Embleya sp. NPDC050154]|uniref:hypothetical protein n=1 Tax=Embleya sp. NPDC050154 TaxID=3363988 RepID=UPI003787E433